MSPSPALALLTRVARSELDRGSFPVSSRTGRGAARLVDTVLAWARQELAEGRGAAASARLAAAADTPLLGEGARAAQLLVGVAREQWTATAPLLTRIDERRLLASVPLEAVRLAAVRAPERVERFVDLLLDADWTPRPTPAQWADVAPAVAAAGAWSAYDRILRRLDAARAAGEPGVDEGLREWLGQWESSARSRREAEQWPAEGDAPGTARLAILDYRHPDELFASTNIGDHVQTLSLLTHVLRQTGLRRHVADDALAARLDDLAARVRPDRRSDGIAGDVRIGVIDRDFSNAARPPAGTWAFVFGWYMWPLVGDRYDFPLASPLETLFVSFHVNDPRFLTDEAVDALRAAAPIGCRDWTTVTLLRGRGVEAFFSGCLTTTSFQYFGARAPGDHLPTAFVDALPGDGDDTRDIVLVEQSSREILRRSFADNLAEGHRFLTDLHDRFGRVVTSRLHTYLPSRGLGTPIDFRPADIDDVRFEGLVGIDDAAFAEMQEHLIASMESALAAIVEGQEPAAVRALWRELWADRLALAQERVQL